MLKTHNKRFWMQNSDSLELSLSIWLFEITNCTSEFIIWNYIYSMSNSSFERKIHSLHIAKDPQKWPKNKLVFWRFLCGTFFLLNKNSLQPKIIFKNCWRKGQNDPQKKKKEGDRCTQLLTSNGHLYRSSFFIFVFPSRVFNQFYVASKL